MSFWFWWLCCQNLKVTFRKQENCLLNLVVCDRVAVFKDFTDGFDDGFNSRALGGVEEPNSFVLMRIDLETPRCEPKQPTCQLFRVFLGLIKEEGCFSKRTLAFVKLCYSKTQRQRCCWLYAGGSATVSGRLRQGQEPGFQQRLVSASFWL